MRTNLSGLLLGALLLAAGGISLRGLSGGSAQMMVLVDGHPQYAGIFGHPISDAYQSLLADKVEVLRGPASVLYGSNAMGGVVNIVTRKQHTDGHCRDMGFEQSSGYAKVGYDITSNWNAYADVNVTHFNASYPGPVSAPLVDGDQRVTRGVASLAVTNTYERTSGALSFFYNWGKHWINDGYTPSKGQTSRGQPLARRHRVDTSGRRGRALASRRGAESISHQGLPLSHPARDVHVPAAEPRFEARIDVEL